MQHLSILPILLPLITGALLLLPPLSKNIKRQRVTAILSMFAQVIVGFALVVSIQTEGVTQYILGDWRPPFGIVLVADAMSTVMVAVTNFLAFGALCYATGSHDRTGGYFYPLFMFQVMGINGAFLTGDAFNLFVFFEILLIASYALLVHGGGKQKTQATVHYVILNLAGSSVFLFGLGILYGTLGTLNIADMAQKVSELDGSVVILTKIGALMLLVVFGMKSAMLPLHFWLPKTYSSASAPVAAIFAVMTKVGIYSIFRIHGVVFGDDAGELAHIAQSWLWPLALMTIVVGTIGVLASPSLKLVTANLVVLSAGTLLVCAALQNEAATSAALYYMIHSTLVAGGMFLLADLIGRQRGKAEDRFVMAKAMDNPVFLAIFFSIAAIAIIGMPPFSGFIGKIMILQSVQSATEQMWVWPIVLLSSLGSLIALSRAGTTLFWRYSTNKQSSGEDSQPIHLGEWLGIVLLLSASPILALFAGPLTDLTNEAAAYLFNSSLSVDALLTAPLSKGGV
ncbi:monovalent cation/H+ antiporter subunit D [Marinomonas atlantica]|uniref:monovalent cation/H+ antiporter subunit D n=1 Tax=Marinomonas atlantica TaxID=1806668 RepID=UPI00082A7DEC|nr:monovalent cation/H+ antiporter subunit D [Marinomonas atlantica]MCO4785578.1 monovalent cation/H+ antiporter subunit D [Marinomonas atlantica]